MIEFKDRIKEFRRVKASELLANPLNHRIHPEPQKKAIRRTLQDIGFAGALLCRVHNGKLLLLDGHMRAAECGNREVPVLVLDVTEEEGNKILASYDAIGAMARENEKALSELMATFAASDEDFSLHNESSIFDDMEKDEEEKNKELKEKEQKLKDGEEPFGVKYGDIWRIRSGSYLYCGHFDDDLFYEMCLNQSKRGRVLKDIGHYRIMIHAPRDNNRDYAGFDILSSRINLDEGWTLTNNNLKMVSSVLKMPSCKKFYMLTDKNNSQISMLHTNDPEYESHRMDNTILHRVDRGSKAVISIETDIPPLMDGGMVINEPAANLIAKLKKMCEMKDKTCLLVIPSANTGALLRLATMGSYCKILAAEINPDNCESILQGYFKNPGRNNKRRDQVEAPEKMDKWKISTEL